MLELNSSESASRRHRRARFSQLLHLCYDHNASAIERPSIGGVIEVKSTEREDCAVLAGSGPAVTVIYFATVPTLYIFIFIYGADVRPPRDAAKN
ncbi:hypothetical protein EVAR_58181_1 [Eumeta japonica]|uniref:Uncharacterized protein n=1 Tax=Eumeta variegata TaxID=151549 RepID=A0A4C1YPK1_EUMVA|nr:hypothetical protein EVAR_58181_1 [Eumeta japonica]